MKCLLFVLLFGFISLGAIGGCNNHGGGDQDELITTILKIFNEGPMTTVFVVFQPPNCITIDDFTVTCDGDSTPCMMTDNLHCNFTIGSGNTCTIPLQNPQTCSPTMQLSSFTLGIGGAPGCTLNPLVGTTVFELDVFGGSQQMTDTANISVVNGFTVPISASMDDGTMLGPVTSVGGTDNESNFGVFPVGCSFCTSRPGAPPPPPTIPGGCPCNGDCTNNTGCHPTENGQPNPVCIAMQPSGGTITLNILENEFFGNNGSSH